MGWGCTYGLQVKAKTKCGGPRPLHPASLSLVSCFVQNRSVISFSNPALLSRRARHCLLLSLCRKATVRTHAHPPCTKTGHCCYLTPRCRGLGMALLDEVLSLSSRVLLPLSSFRRCPSCVCAASTKTTPTTSTHKHRQQSNGNKTDKEEAGACACVLGLRPSKASPWPLFVSIIVSRFRRSLLPSSLSLLLTNNHTPSLSPLPSKDEPSARSQSPPRSSSPPWPGCSSSSSLREWCAGRPSSSSSWCCSSPSCRTSPSAARAATDPACAALDDDDEHGGCRQDADVGSAGRTTQSR